MAQDSGGRTAGRTAPAAAVSLRSGEVLRGKYRIERSIGRGGMGMVYVATHLVLSQRVAIKIVSPDSEARPHAAARFVREARAAALLRSEHVVRIMDVDATERGQPFIVMELLTGADLGEILERDGPLQLERAVGDLLETCEALAEAHARGIVHRDLKPSNLFRAEIGRARPIIKLLDFGISKIARADEDIALTDASAIIGSPFYMSPEQLLSSKDVDARSDIWSLGVTLYQLLSGALPFDASTSSAVGALIAARDPRPFSQAWPEVPADLERVVMRCLAKDAASRFATVLELAHALAPFAGEAAAEALAAIERAALRGATEAAVAGNVGDLGGEPTRRAAAEDETQSAARWTVSRQGEGAPSPKLATPSPEAARNPVRDGSIPGATDYTTAAGDDAGAAPLHAPTRGRARLLGGVAAVAAIAGVLALALGHATPAPRTEPSLARSVAPSDVPPPSQSNAPLAVQSAASASASANPIAVPSAEAAVVDARDASTPPVRARPRVPVKPAATWAKDPAELELK